MIELSINNLTKFYGAHKIFENISFELKTGERMGLIGQNGCGKTTLMKILMGETDYQIGSVSIRKDVKIGYLDQIFQHDLDAKAIDILNLAFSSVSDLRKQMKELEEKMCLLQADGLEKAIKNYGLLAERYEQLGGYDIDTQISKVAQGLKISEQMLNIPFEKLSGGEKTRVVLAKLLLEAPDILLLDEPSNHLDMKSIQWLEGFLKEYSGSVLMISHDRYFLDCVVTKIVELESTKAVNYAGNYSYYVVEKERRFLLDLKEYQNQQKKIDSMERQIERYRIWGAMRDSEVMYKRAKELEKRLEKIEVIDRPVIENRKMKLSGDMERRSGKIVLEVSKLSKSFDEKQLLKDIEFTVFYQDSACLIGENGSGKTTLLKMVLAEIEQDQGVFRLGAGVKIGYLPQNVVFEDEEQTLLDYFSYKHNITGGEARTHLARGLFMKDDVNKKIRSLSGGEKSRLKLCSLTYEKVNFMILDEPTNHLDIDSREILEQTLMDFEGTILFVSHDRYFIKKIADKMLHIEKGELRIYPFEFEKYKEELQKQEAAKPNNETKPQSFKAIAKKKPDEKNVEDHSKKIETLEIKIEEAEHRVKELEEQMLENSSNVGQLNEIFEEKQKQEQLLQDLYTSWEGLQG